MDWSNLLRPESLVLVVPVLAIAAGVVQMVLKHRERMAMIEHGMDPRRLDQRSLEKPESERR